MVSRIALGSTLVVVCLVATPRSQGQDTIARAQELLKSRQYEQVITLLTPAFGASFTSVYCFYEAHRALNRRAEFIDKARGEADKGNPFASYFAARAMLDWIVSEPKSIERYLLNAAGAGNSLAAHRLGNIYFAGLAATAIIPKERAVEADPLKAQEMFSRCRLDSIVGQDCAIGLAHVLLALSPPRPAEAIKAFEEAKAFGALWGVYYFGVQVPVDRTKAATYLARIRARESSPTDTCSMDVAEFADGLEKDEPEALVSMARNFTVVSSRAECLPGPVIHYIDLLERAVKGGSTDAASYLADHYYSGDIVRRDRVLAFYFYSILNSLGNVTERQKATDRLNSLEKTMPPGELTEAQSMFRRWRR